MILVVPRHRGVERRQRHDGTGRRRSSSGGVASASASAATVVNGISGTAVIHASGAI